MGANVRRQNAQSGTVYSRVEIRVHKGRMCYIHACMPKLDLPRQLVFVLGTMSLRIGYCILQEWSERVCGAMRVVRQMGEEKGCADGV